MLLVIDVTIPKTDYRWKDTIDMLNTLIPYGTPPNTRFGVVLLSDNGDGEVEVPIELSMGYTAAGVLNYLNNDMPSLGGNRNMR